MSIRTVIYVVTQHGPGHAPPNLVYSAPLRYLMSLLFSFGVTTLQRDFLFLQATRSRISHTMPVKLFHNLSLQREKAVQF